jgi:hypothetical protein
MKIEIFDPYEIRARLSPAFIIFLPYLLIAIAFSQIFEDDKISISIFAVAFVFIFYFFSFIVRWCGEKKEPGLWESWGGPPSTRYMQDDDETFANETKKQIKKAVFDMYEIKMNNKNIKEAFRLVRQYIRKNDPNGLWYMKNAEYGFLLNLYGSYQVLVLNSLVSATVFIILAKCFCGMFHFFISLMSLSMIIVILSFFFGHYALPKLVKSAAESYAVNAWLSFLNDYQTKYRNGTKE